MNFQDTNPEDNTEKKQNEGFFANLIANLFKSNNPEAEKKRKLKIIAKNLSKTKFHNYYKPSTTEIMPSFAKLFYEIYKIISPAQLLFKANPNTNIFKNQILNFCMSNSQLELLEHFDERKITEVARQVPLANIIWQLRPIATISVLSIWGNSLLRWSRCQWKMCDWKFIFGIGRES